MNSVIKCLFGSKLYGTDTELSDTDYKEVFIPSAEEILLGKYQDVISEGTGNSHSKNTNQDVDNDKYSLRKFLNLLIDGDTFALDLLHAYSNQDSIISVGNPEVWDFIYQNRSKFYTCNMKSYLGYLRKQSAKYGVKGSRLAALRQVVEVLDNTENEVVLQGGKTLRVKVGEIRDTLPLNEFCDFEEQNDLDKGGVQTFYNVLGRKFQMTISVEEMKKSIYKLWDEYGERARAAEANEGIDYKALSHALRAGLQIKEIYSTGDLKFPLQDSKLVLEVKQGKYPFKEVQDMLEKVVEEVEVLAAKKQREGMPKSVNRKMWDDLLIQVHLKVVKNYLDESK